MAHTLSLRHLALGALSLGVIGVGIISYQLEHATPANAANNSPAVFISPHQDDETPSMGASIIAHVNAGRNVYVIIAGDGTATGARGAIKAQTGYDLTATQIGAARDKEAIAAITKLGVKHDHIIFKHISETKIDLTAAQGVVNDAVIQFGVNASYITMSWLDASPDHYNLGYALNSRCIPHRVSATGSVAAPQLKDCRFYQSALYQPGSTLLSADKIEPQAYGYYKATSAADKARLTDAITEYGRWDPANGRYAIGAKYSVASQFNYLKTHMQSLYHQPSSAFTNATKSQAESTFVFKNQFGPNQNQ